MSVAQDPGDLIDSVAAVRESFDRLKAAWRRGPVPTRAERARMLDGIATWCIDNQDAVVAALDSDFGGRSKYETLQAEVYVPVNAARQAKKHLRKWMKVRRRPVNVVFLPASAQVVRQPVGVVGIISPWNYPFQLAVAPLVAAIAAGNKVLIKPSELTPATSKLIERLVSEVFDADHVAVVIGDNSVGAAFSGLPFDHLLFTGSTRVGRLVMASAAPNLTPVTLELGGKSPALVHDSFDVALAAGRIAAGKCFNAGQTCIAPDYVLLHADKVDAFVDGYKAKTRSMYPTIKDNVDFTSIINVHHARRLRGLLEDAREKGARIVEIYPGEATDDGERLGPVLVLDVTEDMAIMQEEIFGPLLPVRTVQNLDEALDYINDHPRPLAMYYFDNNSGRVEEVLRKTVAGGVTINDTIYHYAQDDLPFGGAGDSGMGSCHGEAGFITFSHSKSVFRQSKINGAGLLAPPFGPKLDRILKMMIR
ncbi:MAG: coniferyl-aldehyde dehydrogenase [Kiritimatiellia bacterium]|jgi:coniferyl-aldehyde dehydrogenase